jgi:hypothetical protein
MTAPPLLLVTGGSAQNLASSWRTATLKVSDQYTLPIRPTASSAVEKTHADK